MVLQVLQAISLYNAVGNAVTSSGRGGNSAESKQRQLSCTRGLETQGDTMESFGLSFTPAGILLNCKKCSFHRTLENNWRMLPNFISEFGHELLKIARRPCFLYPSWLEGHIKIEHQDSSTAILTPARPARRGIMPNLRRTAKVQKSTGHIGIQPHLDPKTRLLCRAQNGRFGF